MRRLALPAVLSAALAAMAVAFAGPPAQAAGPAGAGSADGRLDVLFVGAHPDDEAGALSTLGQWNEYDKAKVGVLTVTRGEGGGNASGTEEGPALGLLRENEERRAVGKAGVTDIHYLDKVDFYYTVSTPLTAETWDHDKTLEKVVRLVRETRPKVIVTMVPAPLPGQHGNHQMAARLATEAYFASADPKAYPAQLGGEGLSTWAPGRLFQTGGASGPAGSGCAAKGTPSAAASVTYGVWGGRASARNGGKTWAQVEREAQRTYVSQGWGGFPDVPSDPAQIGCDYYRQIHSRVPFTLGNTDPSAMLEGAVLPAKGGLPLGSRFSLTADAFGVTAGRPFKVTARASSPERLRAAKATLAVPTGWNVTGSGELGTVGRSERTATFTVTPPAGVKAGRAQLSATLTAGAAKGQTAASVEVRPAVTGVLEPLPRVSDFDTWADETGVPELTGQVKRVLTLASGASRQVRVDLSNTTASAQSGTVKLGLPAGFTADAASKPYTLDAGKTGSATFTVTNTDTSLPTSNQGGTDGDYDLTITTASSTGDTDLQNGALELVPAAELPKASTAPAVDGKESPGEYPGPELNLSRRWEGSACESADDCSATGKVTWTDKALHVLVKVRDDKQGTVLGADDCKRHWRTDSVEIGIDPRGDSENTSTTFKTGIFPKMSDGKPCFERDADARQGPGEETAPGMRVASTVADPYDGYVIEAEIPFTALPTAVDPRRMGLNVFVYDSDTQDKTGQTRIGWSTWGGVQGDPYRWGLVSLPGHTPPAGMPTTPPPPVMPTDATRSVNAPESIIQAVRTGVPLAAGPAAPRSDTARIAGRPSVSGGSATVRLLATGPGTAHVHVWDGKLLGTRQVEIRKAGVTTVTVPGATGTLTVAFEAAKGGTASSAVRLGG
ncbi:LmbE family N-acetylglucosaminyl deacetylase [Actinomadura luteofluorescens]|uniref:LmbE family N-acetylglucosaminyl deacetylase n=1 Tax=Actinomadura luteofluorescens TaxID=46163 RepID=A0A7Y9EPK9_9ACTN|nr:sugar-binding protein [Actinomadura luteofluorescens]NYD51584.1 LmbE family N-acetylglucosaminyl deacetylase [Actinomadura luteofluorescens]